MSQLSTSRRALALKYRPRFFTDLVGQDLVVRILANGLVQEALSPALLFTGTRGVGKTTLARLLARALNCPNRDKNTGDPCGTCEICMGILEDHHLDVIEMDAASHTGVEDIRGILDACQYKPVACRCKVYIIDEVHMLSKSAFNALLKTLEEPPTHVQFIFATTEMDRVPETILSRCLRLDLRPVETDLLAQHLASIAQKEGLKITPAAFTLLARSARGSVRDALSLLERASYLERDTLTVQDVHVLLGLADETRLEELITACIKGDVTVALHLFREMRKVGAIAKEVLTEILNALHAMTCFRVNATLIEETLFSETVLAHLKALSASLSVPALSRLWAIFFKGFEEVISSPYPELSTEMILVRACYTAPLPDLYTLLHDDNPQKETPSKLHSPTSVTQEMTTFKDILHALERHREPILLEQIKHDVRLVTFAPGKIEFCCEPTGAQDITTRLAAFLERITGKNWNISWCTKEGGQTVAEEEAHQQEKIQESILNTPFSKHMTTLFPGATLERETKEQ
ncbi:MAG: DNA polymerase III subunit gamma/tau [Holosporales bacterium]|jgi:DNA polymerase-3 subunit gamma/tau|nr:DNA polymerase III subunit gamma/tau [Holosporales bacterium]